MRVTVGLLVASGLFCSPVLAQEGLTYDFSGRIGLGWLNSQTATERGRGFNFIGNVVSFEGTGVVDFAPTDTLSFGAVARVTAQKGDNPNYEANGGSGSSAGEFDSEDIDLAAYASWDFLTISFGEMQTAFQYATRKVHHGESIIDGGNAVWQGIGDGTGNLGSVDSTASGPGQTKDFVTVRADIAVSDLVITLSESREGSFSNFSGSDSKVRSTGVFWQREIGAGSLFLGRAHERGERFWFRSTSLGWTLDGLELVISSVKRTPTPLVDRSALQGRELTYIGLSASYRFGQYELGMGSARQKGGFFGGDAYALWVGWEPREDLRIDLEVSNNDFTDPTSFDTSKASLAISYEF